MAEQITFHFEGAFSDEHKMNFYEAARFQYASARLLVKLSQFRRNGKFAKKITNNSNADILITIPHEGSFDISVLAPLIAHAQDTFMSTTLSYLMSYVFDRIVGKKSDSDVVGALNATSDIVSQIGSITENNSETINKALNIIQKDQKIKEKLHAESRDILSARIAELEREKEIVRREGQATRIDAEREKNLIEMSAPLVSEMATALRRSANTLQIITETPGTVPKNILFLNRDMASELELSVVDKTITSILGDIIQYNKESGWGKIRTSLSEVPLSFSVPSDTKGRLQSQLLSAMGNDLVYIQSYVVRGRAGEPIRLIIVGILPPPPR